MAKTLIFISLYDTKTLSLAPNMLAQAMGGEVWEYSIFKNTAEEIIEDINREHPAMVGFSVYVWNSAMVKEILPKVNVATMVGGPHVTDIQHEFEADVVVTGDVQLPDFTYSRLSLDKYEWLPFETSRGCPMGCGYCTWSGNKMQYRDIGWVKRELDTVLSSNVKWIYLCDSSLLFNKPRAKVILQFCGNYKKPIRFEFGIGQLDDELIELILGLPKSEFNFGVQTINPEPLRIIGRGFNQAIFEKECRALSTNHNITIDLIYGLPGDSFEGYKRSLDYVASLKGIRRILTNPLVLLPGSRFWRERDKYGIKFDPATYLVTSTNTFSNEDMRKARNYSFEVVKRKVLEDAPDLIPTVKEGFEKRNEALHLTSLS